MNEKTYIGIKRAEQINGGEGGKGIRITPSSAEG
jgi:hypothetical protein